MTKETIEWYSVDELKPPFQPGTNVIVIMANGMFAADAKWMGNMFVGPERNSMQWMPLPMENIKLWAAYPTGGDNLIVMPSPLIGNHQVRKLR